MAPIPSRGQKRVTSTSGPDQASAGAEAIGVSPASDGILAHGVGFKADQTIWPVTRIDESEHKAGSWQDVPGRPFRRSS
jgi:hypothetical protein